ncbi:MAG TPA: MbtH family protein [Actinocrinis sp.]|uniref:MbtH family protein n=1 Tax=Actinocrinis sp. TaxID=1920516 RepID=UPI002DDD6912|nr:MbtH family protein [Actinocrinis sp.]HEV2342591.1 MbtH family protein [Actinocrinis sp.]
MFDDDERRFTVVRNDEEQYSIWPEGLAVPGGWTAVGVAGTKAECLTHIAGVWTDLRPASSRRAAGEPNR